MVTYQCAVGRPIYENVATMSQVLNLKKHELDQLAQLMGQCSDTWEVLPSEQTAEFTMSNDNSDNFTVIVRVNQS